MIDVLVSIYVEEVWLSEFPSTENLNSAEIVDILVEGGLQPDKISLRLWTKIQNVYKAARKYLVDCPPMPPQLLTVHLIKEIHEVLGKDVIPDCGSFRKCNVKARSSTVIYATHCTIEGRLSTLISFFKSMAAEAPTVHASRVIFTIKLCTVFFSEFLLIHPFPNGNGRTARLLFSILLREIINMPISIYLPNGRQEYLKVLQARDNLSPPKQLLSYVLCACNRSASIVNWLGQEETEDEIRN